MRQIRPIEQSEGEDFLRVLCEVFDLDFKRAASIFFHEPMFDIDRKWALFEDGGIASILTTVPLEFGWGRAVWIAGVATIAQRQRQGLASELISEVLRHGAASGEAPALLFAKRPGLYESLGFECLDEVIRAQIRFRPEVPCEVLEF
ncbi:MAG TPA: GNAT family N-acetyltransferase, partial [Fimbriimonadaceae bacterium]|nr:GNAT family N-acetyltransferase [Fimbriimonadaceae bacterium]